MTSINEKIYTEDDIKSMNTGSKIKAYRLNKGLTQEQLGKLLNVSRPTISSWEVGSNTPDLDSIIDICDLFHISIDSFLREDRDMTKKISKKLKWNSYYKYILGSIAIAVLVYVAFNVKQRLDEDRYITNLKTIGWSKPKSGFYSQVNAKNVYAYSENGYSYNTFIVPAGLWPNSPKNIQINAHYKTLAIVVSNNNKIEAVIDHQNDPTVDYYATVSVNTNAQLTKPNKHYSAAKNKSINDYLIKHHKNYIAIIKNGIAMRNKIVH